MAPYVTSLCSVICAGLTCIVPIYAISSHLSVLSMRSRISFSPARTGLFCAPNVVLETNREFRTWSCSFWLGSSEQPKDTKNKGKEA